MDEVRARRHGGHSELGGPSGGGGVDLISALPDDVIILVLVRLRCACAAARTGLLSRRWRGLWTRLPDLFFRDVVPGSLLAALSSLAPGGVSLSLLDIHVPSVEDKVPANRVSPSPRTGLRSSLRRRWPANYVSSLLRAAGRLSPAVLRFNHPQNLEKPYIDVDLSACFRLTTSIELHGLDLVSFDRRDSFPALESLSLSVCRVKLTDLILRCPLLRVLRVVDGSDQMSIIVLSTSLQEMHVEKKVSPTFCIDIQAPVLKQLTLSFSTGCGIGVRVSILAPSLEKVSWRCSYITVTAGIGIWGLLAVRLDAVESNDTRSVPLQLPHAHVMSLFVGAHHSLSFPKAEVSFAAEIEKHMVTDFSVLELHFVTRGHVFGAFVLCLFRMHRMCAATQSLKIILSISEGKQACQINCPCGEAKNWHSQTITLTNLETVEIKGFRGEDHEFDFLKLIFRRATMLKRVAVRLSDEVTTSDDWCMKIYGIFKAYPFVEYNIDLSPCKHVLHA